MTAIYATSRRMGPKTQRNRPNGPRGDMKGVQTKPQCNGSRNSLDLSSLSYLHPPPSCPTTRLFFQNRKIHGMVHPVHLGRVGKQRGGGHQSSGSSLRCSLWTHHSFRYRSLGPLPCAPLRGPGDREAVPHPPARGGELDDARVLIIYFGNTEIKNK